MRDSLKHRKRSLIRILLIPSLLLCSPVATGLQTFAETYVEGEVEGEWTRDGHPYFVTDDIVVPPDEQLTIFPGVDVVFLGYYSFEIQGILFALGGMDERERITIGNDTLLWQGISFNRCEEENASIVQNCDIVNAWIGIDCIQTSPHIEHSKIDAHLIGINCDGSSPSIINNHLIRVTGSDVGSNLYAAIRLLNESAPIIHRDSILCIVDTYGEGYGIHIRDYSSPSIEENWIEVSSIIHGAGIDGWHLNRLEIVRNIIRVSAQKELMGIYLYDATGVTIYNNDVVFSGTCKGEAVGIVMERGSQCSMTNNIVVGNNNSIGVSVQYAQVILPSGYNTFWLHNQPLDGFWPNFWEYNFEAEPLFADPEHGDYQLLWEDYPDSASERSPCIDAGYPDPSWNDPDGTRSDIGRYFFNQVPVDDTTDYVPNLEPEDLRLLMVFPNPFNGSTSVSFVQDMAGQLRLNLFDPQGRRIRTLWTGFATAGTHTLRWNAEGLAAGEYLLLMERPGRVASRRIVLLP